MENKRKITEEDVYRVLKESDEPLSTKKISEELEVDWHTAKRRLDKLVDSGKVHKKRWKANMTLYWNKPIF